MNDGRAISICSLGTLISGEVAASDSLQTSGLIKYRGSLRLSGFYSPAPGTIVTLQYTQNGTTYIIPKRMRVKSSFANPLTRTTDVEIGCLLDYKSDIAEPEEIDAEVSNRDYSGDPEQGGDTVSEGPSCGIGIWTRNPALTAAWSESWAAKNGITALYWTRDYRRVGASISASWAMAYCLAKLGITASSIPLTSNFRIQKFDFTPGYVQVLDQLLNSESFVAEMDQNDILQVVSLLQDGGTGPVLSKNDIISLGPIGTGELPASSLGVRYKTWRFNVAPDPNRSTVTIGARNATGSGDIPVVRDFTDPVSGQGLPGTAVDPETGLPQDPQKIRVGQNGAPFPGMAGGAAGGTGASYRDVTSTGVENYDSPGWDYSATLGLPITAHVTVPTDVPGEGSDIRSFASRPGSFSRTAYGFVGDKKVAIETYSERTSTVSADAPDYLGAQLKVGGGGDQNLIEATLTQRTYNSDGSVSSETETKKQSAISVAGASNISFYWRETVAGKNWGRQSEDVITVSNSYLTTSIVKQLHYYAGGTRLTVTHKWLHWLLTQPGQQGAAAANKIAQEGGGINVARDYLGRALNAGLYYLGSERTLNASPVEKEPRKTGGSDQGNDNCAGPASRSVNKKELTGNAGYQFSFPGEVEVSNQRLASTTAFDGPVDDQPSNENGATEEETEIRWVFGGAQDERRKVIEMPLPGDDSVIPTGSGGFAVVAGRASQQALNYGRSYNRITYGYRYGLEIQTPAFKMPPRTFDPFYLSIDGLVAQYRVNNRSWVLNADEAVASCNAIYWGVVGTT